MIRLALPLLAALGLALPLAAQQLPAQFVDAEARWVAHVDVGGVFKSELLRHVLNTEGVDVSSDELIEMASAYDLDPGRDIRSITVYGTEEDPERAVALVSGTAALSKAIDHLLVALKRTEVSANGVTLHRWREREGGDDSIYTYMASKADTDERVLIVSAQPEVVARAVAVVRGERSSLSGSDPSLTRTPAPGTLFFATVSESLLKQLDLDGDAPMQVTEMVRGVRVEFGEHTGSTFLDARVTTAQAAQAAQLLAIIEGGRAFLNLAASAEPEARKALPFVQRLAVQRDGSDVHLRLEYPTAELMTMLHELSDGEFGHDVDIEFNTDFKQPASDPKPAGSTGWR
ncbi:MAG: hypothetical protein DHS20C15_20150 [Planctomycetota bacterium]|nr:MAG: hypothetical protein DHS20C15_20150 [Planctomycetota bacterium]